MRPIQPLVRLPHSHIDPNWLSTVERASGTPPREFYEWVADHILNVTGSLPGSRLVGSDLRAWHRLWTDYGVLGNIRLASGLATIRAEPARSNAKCANGNATRTRQNLTAGVMIVFFGDRQARPIP